MKHAVAATALFVTTALSTCSVDGGNSYCNQVQAVTYTGVGGSGSYNAITNMNNLTKTCSSQPKSYSGSLAPFDEELSVHVRGPIQLKSFAAYVPGGSGSSKARRSDHAQQHGHRHGHMHKHREAVTQRDVGDIVTATLFGKVVSWTNEYSGGGDSTPTASSSFATSYSNAATTSAAVSPDAPSPVQPSQQPSQQPSSSASDSAPSSVSGGSTPGGAWGQTAYYSADQQSASGLVFLNHHGGQGSGVFDNAFGNSLSYASSDGMSGSASQQTLASTTLPSSGEIVIMTDKECDTDGSCGYYRPGSVAYHGFSGVNKAFFFEFQMPDSGQTSASEYDAVNMPAIWFLNAQIPRTLQYGQSDCSCWTTGCGEFDVFEVLTAGSTKAKSTIHGNKAGGDSDYFARPESSTIKVAVVMTADTFHIKIIDDSTQFGSSMTADDINQIVSTTNTASNDVSLFSLSGASSG